MEKKVKVTKRKSATAASDSSLPKKSKGVKPKNSLKKKLPQDKQNKSRTKVENGEVKEQSKATDATQTKQMKKFTFAKTGSKGSPVMLKQAKAKKLLQTPKNQLEKEDWTKFKKQKKELRLKRKQSKFGFDLITRAKQIGEDLRRKTLSDQKRVQLINELHSMLRGKEHYARFVLAHDTARIVQWLLKYASDIVIKQISDELVPVTVSMLQSKYGVFCVKRLLKYGSGEVRTKVIDAMFGNVVKLISHSVSAPVVEYAVSTWATPVQKQYLAQEFYGDLYKKSKDTEVKHLRDVYRTDESMKAATLSAVKSNLTKVLNKSLLDSGLVQMVLAQYLSECSEEDKKELIAQLVPHIVVISNSKDGARAAMQCIWHGTNKDRKVIMKTIKEHIIDISKHEHGHSTVIALLDAVDDTVLLHKVILSELLKNAKDLAVSEWGRKVLIWLVAPADTKYFHPQFVKELNDGREASSSKKPVDIRRAEILQYSLPKLVELVTDDIKFWLSNASLASEMLAIIKAGSGDELLSIYKSIVNVITDLDWKIKNADREILGIEDAGIHMILKKIILHDKTFGQIFTEQLDKEILSCWMKINRCCFLMVTVFENGTEEVQKELRNKLKKHMKILKGVENTGAKVLLNKLNS